MTFKAGSIANCRHCWSDLTSDTDILDIVSIGVKLPVTQIVPTFRIPNFNIELVL